MKKFSPDVTETSSLSDDIDVNTKILVLSTTFIVIVYILILYDSAFVIFESNGWMILDIKK